MILSLNALTFRCIAPVAVAVLLCSGFSFGKNIPEKSPSSIFRHATKLFNQGNYWESYVKYAECRRRFPTFNRIDIVNLRLAECLDKFGFFDAALECYNRSIKTHRGKNPQLGRTMLKIVRCAYKLGRYSDILHYIDFIDTLKVSDSIEGMAHYWVGEAAMDHGDYSRAIYHFGKVHAKALFSFAQYSAGVAACNLDDPIKARRYFVSAFLPEQDNSVQWEILNKAYIALGYLYLDGLINVKKSLSTAVILLRQVPRESIWYADALVGLCWAAVRSKQWNDCIAAGTELMHVPTLLQFRAEGSLTTGYALCMTGRMKKAMEVLSEGSEMLEKEESRFHIDSMAAIQMLGGYSRLGSALEKLSAFDQTEPDAVTTDSLHKEQQRLSTGIDSLAYFKRRSYFKKRETILKADIEYLAAHCSRMFVEGKKADEIKKLADKEKGIEAKIRQLQDKMKETR